MIQKITPPPEQNFTWLLYGCVDSSQMKNGPRMLHALKRSLQEANIDTYGGLQYQFTEGGEGVTAVEIVGASCADVHTWPECGAAVVRCFACGDKEAQVRRFAQNIIRRLQPTEVYELPPQVLFVEKPMSVPQSWIKIAVPAPQSAVG